MTISKSTYLPFLRMDVSKILEFRIVHGLPVIQMTAVLWLKLGRELPMPHENLGLLISVQMVSLVRGPSFS